MIIVNQQHLNSVLQNMSITTTAGDPSRVGATMSNRFVESVNKGAIYRREVLGGLINDYCREVA